MGLVVGRQYGVHHAQWNYNSCPSDTGLLAQPRHLCSVTGTPTPQGVAGALPSPPLLDGETKA